MFGWLRKRFPTNLWQGVFGRSREWPRVRREHLDREPVCVACGRQPKDIEVHHVEPYHRRPDLELEPTNLITLCRNPCHFVFGHLLNWSKCNPHVREDAARFRQRMVEFGVEAEPASSGEHPDTEDLTQRV